MTKIGKNYGNCGGCGNKIPSRVKNVRQCSESNCGIWWHSRCATGSSVDGRWKCSSCEAGSQEIIPQIQVDNVQLVFNNDVPSTSRAPDINFEIVSEASQVNTQIDVDVDSGASSQQPLPYDLDLDLPSMEILFSTFIPTLKWAPKATRGEIAREVSVVWGRAASHPEDLRNWKLLLMFWRTILPAGRGPRISDAYSQTRLVRERLRRWRGGEYKHLWDEATTLTKQKKSSRKKTSQLDKTQADINAERAAILASEGQYSKAIQALTSEGMAPVNRATEAQLRRLHPSSDNIVGPLPVTDVQQLSFTEQEVLDAANKFKKGSAPGPSGLRPEHLKSVVRAAPNRKDRALSNMTKLVNLIMSGKVPESVAPFLCGARLHAANKKDGGIRPIAVGNLERRLVSKCAAFSLSNRAAAFFSPNQLGVGVRGGCEALVHSVREVLDLHPNKMLLQVDLINAFNKADRFTAIDEVAQHFPEILEWVKTSYASPSCLLYNNKTINSESGFHQGDPLASLLFSLVLQPLVLKIQEKVPTLAFNGWYLDDGSQIGEKEELQQVIDLLLEDGPARGLHLSTYYTSDSPKCQVWTTSSECDSGNPLDRGIPRVQEDGFTFLGAPIGSNEYTRNILLRKIQKIRQITSLLPNIKKPHLEFVLLRSCLSLPKFMFLLRTVPTTRFPDLLNSFDECIREALIASLGTPLEDKQWLQTKLPISQGGLGIRSAADHAGVAYSCSFFSSQNLMKQLLQLDDEVTFSLGQDIIGDITNHIGFEPTTEMLETIPQKQLSTFVDTNNFNALKEIMEAEGNIREIARINSLSLPYAGAWLETVPIPALGLYLQPSEFVQAIRYRLGCPIYDRAGPCPACQKESDELGDHAMCCAHQGERITRHNALRDAIHNIASAAALNPIKEGQHLLPGNNRRPADIYLRGWAAGRDAALDVTVTNPLQQATIQGAATSPGHALRARFSSKMNSAAEQCQAQGISFLPLVFESLGGWDEHAVMELKKLSSALSRNSGEDENELWRKTTCRISIILMKGNAALLSGRFPISSDEFLESGII